MITIQNTSLTVSILDPVDDRDKFGTRYCTGGYIFQVTDAEHGDLLSGPTYPEGFNWYDGQGIPDAFSRAPLTADGESNVLIPGIGIVDPERDTVVSHCEWDVAVENFVAKMLTRQCFGTHDIYLERKVGLSGRSLRSSVRFRNHGKLSIPIRWFPHPFFPQPEGLELCRFNVPVFLPDNEGYGFAKNGFICRRSRQWDRDYYQALDLDPQSNLQVLQRHPKLGLIAGACSYVPTFLPIWGNSRTFSWEPYLECTVAPGQEKRWHIDYIF